LRKYRHGQSIRIDERNLETIGEALVPKSRFSRAIVTSNNERDRAATPVCSLDSGPDIGNAWRGSTPAPQLHFVEGGVARNWPFTNFPEVVLPAAERRKSFVGSEGSAE
jgi:hypothetical protein